MQKKGNCTFRKSKNKDNKIQNWDKIKELLHNAKLFIKGFFVKSRKKVIDIVYFIIFCMCIYFGVIKKQMIFIILLIIVLCINVLPSIFMILKCIPFIIKNHYTKSKIRMQRVGIDIIISIAIALVLLTAFSMKVNIFNIKNYNPDFGSLIGGAISGIATLFVIRHTLTIDDRRAIDKARVSARILSENISNCWDQMADIDLEGSVKISYINNWLEYYRDISYVAKYEYLTILLKEFQYIDTINSYIEQGNKEKIKSTLNERKFFYRNYTGDFDITDAYMNISSIENGFKEEESWKHQKSNITIINGIEKELYTVVEKKIYEILIRNSPCEFGTIKDELLELVKSYNKFEHVERRVIIIALINICVRINEESNRIEFVWNELKLK